MISHDFIHLDISTFFSQISHLGENFFQKFLRRPLPQNLQILANLSLCGLGGFPYKSVMRFYYLTFHQKSPSYNKISPSYNKISPSHNKRLPSHNKRLPSTNKILPSHNKNLHTTIPFKSVFSTPKNF